MPATSATNEAGEIHPEMGIIESVLSKLTTSIFVDPGGIVGASQAEIESLERELGVSLPDAYRRFLACCGNSAGSLLMGTDISLACIASNRDQATRLLAKRKSDWTLPASAVVLAVHQGYQFLFFLADGRSDDPPVFHCLEGQPAVKVAESFSQWLEGAIADEEGLESELRHRRSDQDQELRRRFIRDDDRAR